MIIIVCGYDITTMDTAWEYEISITINNYYYLPLFNYLSKFNTVNDKKLKGLKFGKFDKLTVLFPPNLICQSHKSV